MNTSSEDLTPLSEEYDDPYCSGCKKLIEDGSVVQFGNGIWHFECFRCAKCEKLVECYSNLLLLRDGSPICEDCSYSCNACHNTITDEAIMTGEDAYHADCFRCVHCNTKIEDLVFTQTSKGIFCTSCHELRKQMRLKQKRKEDRKQQRYLDVKTPQGLASNTSMNETMSILNPQELAELNAMLNASAENIFEDTIRNPARVAPVNEDTSSAVPSTGDSSKQVVELKKELKNTQNRLKEVETKFNKMKLISRKALDEFNTVKEKCVTEAVARREAEENVNKLMNDISLYQRVSVFGSNDYTQFTKDGIAHLDHNKTELDQTISELRKQRDLIMAEIDDAISNHSTLKAPYQEHLKSIRLDIATAKASYNKLARARDDIIKEMIMLNTKNAELTTLNNDLSRRMTEREREAMAVIAGTSFPLSEGGDKKQRRMMSCNPSDFEKLQRSEDIAAQNTAQRNSLETPRKFVLRRNKSKKIHGHNFSKSKSTQLSKCSVCQEKMRVRGAELRCQGCDIVCHFDCISKAPPCSSRLNSTNGVAASLVRSGSHGEDSPKSTLFGNDLAKQVRAENGMVPLVVQKCIEAVEARGIDVEGIYRKDGGTNQIRMIKKEFEQGNMPDLRDENWGDICAVTSVVKQYFRDLPDPLFTYELHSSFVHAAASSAEHRFENFRKHICSLPTENFHTLKYLMLHLDNVQKQCKDNLMTCKNLAVVFWPTLMRSRDESCALTEMDERSLVIEYIIANQEELFKAVPESPQVSSHHSSLPVRQNSLPINAKNYHRRGASNDIMLNAVHRLPITPTESAGYI